MPGSSIKEITIEAIAKAGRNPVNQGTDSFVHRIYFGEQPLKAYIKINFMQTKLLEPCGECRDCYFLNSGIKEGLLAFFNGDYRGLGIMEFYFEKILDYRPDMEDLNHMLAYCRDCTQQTIFNKAPYEEILSALRDIESIMDDLSDEEKGLFIMEIRNSPKVERLMKIYG